MGSAVPGDGTSARRGVLDLCQVAPSVTSRPRQVVCCQVLAVENSGSGLDRLLPSAASERLTTAVADARFGRGATAQGAQAQTAAFADLRLPHSPTIDNSVKHSV